MFIQIIRGALTDPERFQAEASRWGRDLKPGAVGYLGATWGVTADGTGFLAARFDSADSARANSERPEQGEWWAGMEPAFADVSFVDTSDIDTMMGGGSNDAGFVQVIQGRAKDQAAARSMLASVEPELRQARPDIAGVTMAWHGDDGSFTQIVYFDSEGAARGGESGEADDTARRYEEMMAETPTFLDISDPHFD
jgi:hypothetical protein